MTAIDIKIQFLKGRKDGTAPAPDGTVPLPFDSVDKILARMADGGSFTPAEVVALLSAHSVGASDNVCRLDKTCIAIADKSIEG